MSYPVWAPGSDIDALWRVAHDLRHRTQKQKGCLPIAPMWLFTDPVRTPDPMRIAERLPQGSGIVYRGFGRAEAAIAAVSLAAISRRRGLCLLIGQDAELADRVGADGVHLPERSLRHVRDLRRRHPNWVITGAAHDICALRRAETSGCDAIFVSAIFPSLSPSARRPIGPFRLAALAKHTSLPVLALGGVNARTARRLIHAYGLAAIDAFT